MNGSGQSIGERLSPDIALGGRSQARTSWLLGVLPRDGDAAFSADLPADAGSQRWPCGWYRRLRRCRRPSRPASSVGHGSGEDVCVRPAAGDSGGQQQQRR